MATTTDTSVKISAVDIKKLWYCDPSKITMDATKKDFTSTLLATLLENTTDLKEVTNIHQDTWSLEESEASQDSYRNQLSGNIYRFGRKTPGEITVKFTIGQYDNYIKAAFLGGEVLDNGQGWKRGRGVANINYAIIALTYDDVYCVLPYASIKANEANTDKAIGISVTATAQEPVNENLSPEYWFNKECVKKMN